MKITTKLIIVFICLLIAGSVLGQENKWISFSPNRIPTVIAFELIDNQIILTFHESIRWMEYTEHKYWKEVYGVIDGKITLLKKITARVTPPQPERIEYTDTTNMVDPQLSDTWAEGDTVGRTIKTKKPGK